MKTMNFLAAFRAVSLLIFIVATYGCATVGQSEEQASKSPLVPTGHGTVTLDGAFEFIKPEGYKMFRDLGDGETIFMFFKEEGEFPSQTSFFYNDKVYGNSLELETRIEQFFKYFLVGRGIQMKVAKIEDGMIDGRKALIVHSLGENPYRNEKVRAVGYFYKLGQYIVSLACTQWRPMDGEFDQNVFDEFTTFADSFKYLERPFYEEVEERIHSLHK